MRGLKAILVERVDLAQGTQAVITASYTRAGLDACVRSAIGN